MLGILGNNARNLLYIKKFNDKKAIRLANNKLETKNFLSERGIPFAKTYGIISNRHELFDFDFAVLPKKNFVIKPNQGSKGNGIYITKYLGQDKEFSDELHKKEKTRKKQLKKIFSQLPDEHKPDLYQIGSETVSDNQFRRQLLDIVDGKYSMSLGGDKIIVEEKLIPGELFKEFCEWGLADIRVIVFNLVPVATMIRVPTEESKGKANLAQGGIGLGIDIASGKVISLLYKNKMYQNKFPKKFAEFKGKQIPYRNDILFLSSKVQYYVNLGYLALDWVITNEGPKLLEINARAGLEVQKVTDTRLARMLDKISDIKVNDPEKGVEIAKSLFAKEQASRASSQEKILYLSQYGKFRIKNGEEEISKDVTVEVNLDRGNNRISPNLYEIIKEKKAGYNLDLFDNDIILKDLKFTPLESLAENKIILGKKTAEEFLIKPVHKVIEKVNIVKDDAIIEKELLELQKIDLAYHKLARTLNLSARLRPTNYFNELDKFITLHGNYNPVFSYKWPSDESLKKSEDELRKLYTRTNKLESPMKKLFLEKGEELSNRLQLIRAYKDQNFEKIKKYNTALFGNFNEKLLKLSKEKILDYTKENKKNLGKILKLTEIEDIVEKYLSLKNIYDIEIVFSYDNISRISIIMGKKIKISISKAANFQEKELMSVLAHEVDTHLMRYINGRKSGRKIFTSGTGNYLADEEGLAIRNANEVLDGNYESIGMYKKYFLTNIMEDLSFAECYEFIKANYPERTLEGCFKSIIRAKKGIINTSQTGICYMKDKVYLDGYSKMQKRIEEGHDDKKLYKGKIKIDDLDFIK